MIHFFRRIRRTLLGQEKTGQYLKYAIGDIFLVMVGILLALQVNNWNNQRLNRKLETKYLSGLKADLEVDLVNLDTFIKDREVKYESSLLVLNNPKPTTLREIYELDSILGRIFGWNIFYPSTNVMDELIGSGNLSLIQNDSLKTMLLDVHKGYEYIASMMEHMRREYDYYLYDRSAQLREMSPTLEFERTFKERKPIFTTDISKEREIEIINQADALLSDLSFRNGLKLAFGNSLE